MESLFQALDNAADGALVIDENQRVVYWNRAAQEILGYKSNEVVGRACYEILEGRGDNGLSLCRHHCYVAAIAVTGSPVASYDTCVNTKSGESIWINVSILSFPASDNSNHLVVHLFRDATQKRQSEQFTQQVLDAVKQVRDSSFSPSTFPIPSTSIAHDLTDREREVLALMVEGLNNNQIAARLIVSVSTAKFHVSSILSKLGVASRTEAVAVALQNNLVI